MKLPSEIDEANRLGRRNLPSGKRGSFPVGREKVSRREGSKLSSRNG